MYCTITRFPSFLPPPLSLPHSLPLPLSYPPFLSLTLSLTIPPSLLSTLFTLSHPPSYPPFLPLTPLLYYPPPLPLFSFLPSFFLFSLLSSYPPSYSLSLPPSLPYTLPLSHHSLLHLFQFKAMAKVVLAAKRFTKFGSMENGKTKHTHIHSCLHLFIYAFFAPILVTDCDGFHSLFFVIFH